MPFKRERENHVFGFQLASKDPDTMVTMYFWLLFALGLPQIRGLRDKVPCIENDKFYRNPNRDPAHVWSTTECAKYFFCVEGEVFEFECSTGLTFDINRQICDFKTKVGNCDVTAEVTTPKPLFNTDEPICPTGEHS